MIDPEGRRNSPDEALEPSSWEIIQANVGEEIGVLLRPDEPPGTLHFFGETPNPRQGEDGVEAVCQQVVNVFNSTGWNWSSPHKPEGPEQGIDCISEFAGDILRFQVTRAVHRQELWIKLASKRRVVGNLDSKDALADIMHSITNKARKCSLNSVRTSFSYSILLRPQPIWPRRSLKFSIEHTLQY